MNLSVAFWPSCAITPFIWTASQSGRTTPAPSAGATRVQRCPTAIHALSVTAEKWGAGREQAEYLPVLPLCHCHHSVYHPLSLLPSFLSLSPSPGFVDLPNMWPCRMWEICRWSCSQVCVSVCVSVCGVCVCACVCICRVCSCAFHHVLFSLPSLQQPLHWDQPHVFNAVGQWTSLGLHWRCFTYTCNVAPIYSSPHHIASIYISTIVLVQFIKLIYPHTIMHTHQHILQTIMSTVWCRTRAMGNWWQWRDLAVCRGWAIEQNL